MKEIPSKYPTFQVHNGQLRKFVRLSCKYFDNDDEDWKIVVWKLLGCVMTCRLQVISVCTKPCTVFVKSISGLVSDVVQYVRRHATCIKAKPEQRKPAGLHYR